MDLITFKVQSVPVVAAEIYLLLQLALTHGQPLSVILPVRWELPPKFHTKRPHY